MLLVLRIRILKDLYCYPILMLNLQRMLSHFSILKTLSPPLVHVGICILWFAQGSLTLRKYLKANVVYKFKCNSRERDYIGYTGRPLNVIISEHTKSYSCLSRGHRSFDYVEDIDKDSISIICNGSSVFDLRVKQIRHKLALLH